MKSLIKFDLPNTLEEEKELRVIVLLHNIFIKSF